MRVGSDKPLARALLAHRVPGEEIGVALRKDDVWGLLPFYARTPAVFFGYPPRVGPAASDPTVWVPAAGRFRPLEDLADWFRAPTRRWLLVRAAQKDPNQNPWTALGASGPVVVVAKNERYALVTNSELPR